MNEDWPIWVIALITYPMLELSGKGGPAWVYLLTVDLAVASYCVIRIMMSL